jgi:hypothetical protein
MSVRQRTFKTKWFTKAALAHAVTDQQLCSAIAAVRCGRADDLGGGVFKKRLNKNRDRSIILAKGGNHWFYAYLYAKQDTAGITPRELIAFRKLASVYSCNDDALLADMLVTKELVEICHESTG